MNIVMIATLAVFGGRMNDKSLVVIAAWGLVVGAFAQFAIQLPAVFRYAKHLRFALDMTVEPVREVIRNFTPVIVGKGVVQLSGYVDNLIATLLSTAAVSALSYAQIISFLPISLFGMSVAAAELPQLSRMTGTHEEIAAGMRKRLERGLRQIAFFVVPSATAFILIGDAIVAALYQGGRFHRADTLIVWYILIGSTLGLLAITLGRLYSNAFYALRDTKTPLRYAIVRVVLTTVLGYLCAIPLPKLLGIDAQWGAAGLTASAGVAGWVEMLMLRSTLNARIGRTGLPVDYVAKLWASAAAGAAAAWGMKLTLPTLHPVIAAIAILGPYGAVFFAGTFALRIPEASNAIARIARR